MSNTIWKVRKAGQSQFGFEYWIDNDVRKELIVEASTKDLAIERAAHELQIADVLRSFPYTLEEHGGVKSLGSIIVKGWVYYPKEIVEVITPSHIHTELMRVLHYGGSHTAPIDKHKLHARAIVRFSAF